MKALAHALTPFLLLGLAQPGCKKKPDLPPALSYALETKDLSLAGSTLVVLGQRKEIKRVGGTAHASFDLPRRGPSALGEMKIEVPTPCGPKYIPLRTSTTAKEEEEARAGVVVMNLTVTAESALPPSIEVWLDAKGQKVLVGAAELTREHNYLHEPDCKEASPVLVDGQEVGTLQGKAMTQKALFITGRKSICYALAEVGYGAGIAGAPTMLQNAQVHVIKEGPIDYFLRQAPSIIQTAGKKTPQYRELLEAPCK